MRRLLLLLILATPTTTVHACGLCRRRPCRPTQVRLLYQRPAPVAYGIAPAAIAPAPVQSTAPVQWTPTDEAGAFLASLNLWRAAYGRHPVSWDATLAAYAARNAGIHDGTPNQCWSSTNSLMASLELWKSSPAHAAILLSATVAVGAAPCPSGCTVNAR